MSAKNVEDIKGGDVVRLKSGGPEMTANNVTGNTAQCVWFVSNEVRNASFSIEAITKVETGKAS